MLIKFFPNGKGAGAGPVGYLVAKRVLAYDGNRDLIRDADGQPKTVMRDPLPEVLRGNPERTEALIDASRHQWTYRAGVISFADSDTPTEDQQADVMDAFERLAFAGLDPEQYEVLWVRHRHEGRVELHFCTPRLELTTGKSLNIAPPGYQDAYDSLRDVMNQRHGWADPMELERTQEVRETVEATTRAQGRDELHTWIQDQIDMGLIADRASMIDALTDAGFDLPRTGKAYITVRDPDTGERWRLKGEIFHEDWQADPAERETERGARHDPGRTRRLDLVPAQRLQDRFEEHCGRRAAYHRERYAPLSDRDGEYFRDAAEIDPSLADDLALADRGDGADGDRLDDGRELFLDGAPDALGADGTGPDKDRTARGDLADPGPIEDAPTHLHDGRETRHLHSDRGGLDDPTHSLGTRLARLRRAVGDGLRGLREGFDRLGDTLDWQDREGAGWLERLRDLAHSFTSRIHEGLERIAERGSELQDAGRELAAELDLSEGRRREIEGQLDSQEAHAERGLTH
ncbi:Relaxase/Mobilisation nuclease domain-containing protein [Cognatiyoonia koreensis]|uniref:Relaxase/Mobilisation nuclease domain-containing protein n=1 Tax=Cognatiyoonia koreensis TaxID=364200 RepID=A0A1I0RTT5_9RHOB|nr:relaxase/mobilization nuclease domain-containing protein [Cognatiyoonia koreensis]SEW44723.1 Relaxase/Mobilisation nuclease domain-containing protein [Cognatiyoonia koreensis]